MATVSPPQSHPSFPCHRKATLGFHNGSVLTAVYSWGQSKYILTASSDRRIRLFSTSTASPNAVTSPIQIYDPLATLTRCIAIAPTNTHFLTAGAGDRSVLLWDVEKACVVHRFGGHIGQVNTVIFAAPCQLTPSLSDEKRKKRPAEPPHPPYMCNVAVSGGQDHLVNIWDLRTAYYRDRESHHRSHPTPLSSSAAVASASTPAPHLSSSCHVYTRQAVQTLSDATDAITCVATHKYAIYTASLDGCTRIYDIRMGRMCTDNSQLALTCLAPLSSAYASVPAPGSAPNADPSCEFRDPDNSDTVYLIAGVNLAMHTKSRRPVTLDLKDRFVAATSLTGAPSSPSPSTRAHDDLDPFAQHAPLRLICQRTGRLLQSYSWKYPPHCQPILPPTITTNPKGTTTSNSPYPLRLRCAWGPDNLTVLATGPLGHIWVWDMLTGEPLHILPHHHFSPSTSSTTLPLTHSSRQVTDVAVCNNALSNEWLSAGADGNVVIWGETSPPQA